MQEEEAKTRAEQQEVKRQMFINVQPYVKQNLKIHAQGYSNPFSFFRGADRVPNTFAHGFDFENFDLSSHDDSAASSDYGVINSLDQRDPLMFSALGGNKATKGQRYNTKTFSPDGGQKSDGEIGAAGEDDISLGEIRVPGASQPKRGYPQIGVSPQVRLPTTKNVRPLGETINYEEDKVSPEKEDEKPIYESTEGPIQKTRGGSIGGGRGGIIRNTNVGKSGNMVNSFDSFGMTGLKRSSGMTKPHLRDTIQDDFLVEHDEDEEYDGGSLRASAESGEIRPSAIKKK